MSIDPGRSAALSLDVSRYARLWRWLWWSQRIALLLALSVVATFALFGVLSWLGVMDRVETAWAGEIERAAATAEVRRYNGMLLAAIFRLMREAFSEGRAVLAVLVGAAAVVVSVGVIGSGRFRLRLATAAVVALAVVMTISALGMLHAYALEPDDVDLNDLDQLYYDVYFFMSVSLLAISFLVLLVQSVLVVKLWRHRVHRDLPRTHRMTRSLGINLGLPRIAWPRLSAAGVAVQVAAVAVPAAMAAWFYRWVLMALIFGTVDVFYLVFYSPFLLISVVSRAVQGAPLLAAGERETMVTAIDDPVKLAIIAAVVLAARGAWRVGTRLHRRRRDDVVLKDKPPVLLLRSFADDIAKIPPSALLPRLFFRRKRLEEMVGEELTQVGPFVAIGKPGERLPQLGAQRLYVADTEWQEVVKAYIGRAGRVIMIAGTTQWVQWELASTIAQDALDKLLIVFPRLTDAERAARWENLKSAFQATPWKQAAAEVVASRALALFADQDGRFVVTTSRRAHESDYQAALRIATYLMGRPAQPALASPTDRAVSTAV